MFFEGIEFGSAALLNVMRARELSRIDTGHAVNLGSLRALQGLLSLSCNLARRLYLTQYICIPLLSVFCMSNTSPPPPTGFWYTYECNVYKRGLTWTFCYIILLSPFLYVKWQCNIFLVLVKTVCGGFITRHFLRCWLIRSCFLLRAKLYVNVRVGPTQAAGKIGLKILRSEIWEQETTVSISSGDQMRLVRLRILDLLK